VTAHSDRDKRSEDRRARLAALEARIMQLETEHMNLRDRVKAMEARGMKTSAAELEVRRVEVYCALRAAQREIKRVRAMP
jgi:multidrug resistance efflux pump